jgi:hypothetical protein
MTLATIHLYVEAVETAPSAYEKGRALEELCSQLFASPGVPSNPPCPNGD